MVLGSGSTLRELGRHFLSAGQPEIERDHFCQPQLSGWQLCHQTWSLAGDYSQECDISTSSLFACRIPEAGECPVPTQRHPVI